MNRVWLGLWSVRVRESVATLLAIAALTTLGLGVQPARAQQANPFTAPPVSQAPSATTSTPASGGSSSSTATDGGISSGVLVLVLGAGALLIAGIAWFIVRDARAAAPVGEGVRAGRASKPSPARARRDRARAKEARRQRKRNRR